MFKSLRLFPSGQALLAVIQEPLIIGLYAGALTFGSLFFARFHQLKYFKVRKLRKRFMLMERNAELVRQGHLKHDQQLAEQLSLVRRELWVLTGEKRYLDQPRDMADPSTRGDQ